MRNNPVWFSSCRYAVLCCVLAVGAMIGGSRYPLAQATDPAKATEQLFEAVHANDFEAVQTSIAAGANVDASDRWGMTPVELAIDKGYFQIGHYLVAVRNFRRDVEDRGPATPARNTPTASPFKSDGDGEFALRNSSNSSPLGTITSPTGSISPHPLDTPEVDLETSAGPAMENVRPSNKPNPFDPNAPAYGTNLFAVGRIGETEPGSLSGLPSNDFPDKSSEEGSDESPEMTEQAPFSNRIIGVGGNSQ